MNNTSGCLSDYGPGPWHIDLSLSEFVAWLIPCLLVAIAATVGNVLVIAAFLRAVNLQVRLHFFVVGLSAADIMVGVISIPMWNYILYITWKKLPLSMSFMRAYETMDVFAGVNSILHLMAISMERLYATVRPYSWSQRNYSRKIYFGVLMLIWVLSAMIAALFAFPGSITVDVLRFHLMNTFFFVPLVVICITYLAIWLGLKKRRSSRSGHVGEKSLKLTFTLLIVIGLFVVAWLPFFVVRFVLKECAHFCVSWRIFYVTKLLHFSNSGINPVVYGLRIPEYRTAMLHFLRIRVLESHLPSDEVSRRRSFRDSFANTSVRNSKRASAVV